MVTFVQLSNAFLSVSKTTFAGLALMGLVAPSVVAQEAGLSDFEAERDTIVEVLRDANPAGIGGLLQTFVEVPFSQRAFPGDVDSLRSFRSAIDYRDRYRVGSSPSAENLAGVQRWYDAQIPRAFLAAWQAPNRRAESVRILYLTRCGSGDLGAGVELDLGDKSAFALNGTAYEQARIEVALENEDIDIAPPILRAPGGQTRNIPDRRIAGFNRWLLAEDPDQPRLILEGFCGELPLKGWGGGGVVAGGGGYSSPPYYQLRFPAGVTRAKVAPLLFAKICSKKTGSVTDTSCPEWDSVAPGVPKTGRGRFRMVAREGNAMRTYTYEVLPENLVSGGQPKLVEPIREDP